MGTSQTTTYSRLRGGVRGTVGDAVRLYRVRTTDMVGEVEAARREFTTVDSLHRERCGSPLENRDVLIVGAGQTPRETMAFGAMNRVSAIDLDVIPRGLDPRPYFQLARQNGVGRAVKTVGRKALGIDVRMERAMRKAVAPRPDGAVVRHQMDATKIAFPDASFDVAYSFSVFEHLADPRLVLAEMMRVLRPGGLLYVSTHIYASEGGCHDLRIFSGHRDGIPYWAQLRPPVKPLVVESCFMNKLSIAEWREVFEAECPGVEIRFEGHHEPYATFLRDELDRLRSGGELALYSDEELLTVNIKSIWQRPAG